MSNQNASPFYLERLVTSGGILFLPEDIIHPVRARVAQ